MRSSGLDITLDNVLTILDKHYNNIKALDALNQELFQRQMADKETILDWGIHLLRHLQVFAPYFPECFPPNHMAELKHDHFYGRLPKCLKAMVAYLKASLQKKIYSNYLWATRKQRRRTPWNYPKAPKAKQLITLPNPGQLDSSPCRSLREPASS